MKILHVASFNGNIGDNANHNGLRNRIAKVTGNSDITYTELEIRKFYQNYKKQDRLEFDENFADLANRHDLVIIGGGNFFEVWIDSSSTGTTIDMSPEVIDKIETPIFFFGLGFDPYKGVKEENVNKFKRFIDCIYGKQIHTITVRNDGSTKHIKKYLGEEYTEIIKSVPDGGFFIELKNDQRQLSNVERKYIAVNIAKDMADLRFKRLDSGIDYDTFISKAASLFETFLKNHPDYELVLIPHIYSDLEAIHDLMLKMDDLTRRTKVSVAPLLHGPGSELIIFDIYKNAEIAVGMRFHTNVCSIGLNTPTIGLVSYPNLYGLYEELNMTDRVVMVNLSGFERELQNKMEENLSERSALKRRYQAKKAELEGAFTNTLKRVFEAL